jgi:hypothetical protein
MSHSERAETRAQLLELFVDPGDPPDHVQALDLEGEGASAAVGDRRFGARRRAGVYENGVEPVDEGSSRLWQRSSTSDYGALSAKFQ